MKSKVVFVVVFYTYLCLNLVASIPLSEDSAKYVQRAYQTSGLRTGHYDKQLADFHSQNLVVENARPQREYDFQQSAQQTIGQNPVINYNNHLPLSYSIQNQFQDIKSYPEINQGLMSKSAQLLELSNSVNEALLKTQESIRRIKQEIKNAENKKDQFGTLAGLSTQSLSTGQPSAQPTTLFNQNPSLIFASSQGIKNLAPVQKQRILPSLFGVNQQTSIPFLGITNKVNQAQFTNDLPVSPVITQQPNRYAVAYPDGRFEYKTNIEDVKKQYPNYVVMKSNEDFNKLKRVSQFQSAAISVPKNLPETASIFKATQSAAIPMPTIAPTLTHSLSPKLSETAASLATASAFVTAPNPTTASIPVIAPTNTASSIPYTPASYFTSLPADSSVPVLTTVLNQKAVSTFPTNIVTQKTLTSFDIDEIIALTRKISENAAKKARAEAVAKIEADNKKNTQTKTSALTTVQVDDIATFAEKEVPAYSSEFDTSKLAVSTELDIQIQGTEIVSPSNTQTSENQISTDDSQINQNNGEVGAPEVIYKFDYISLPNDDSSQYNVNTPANILSTGNGPQTSSVLSSSAEEYSGVAPDPASESASITNPLPSSDEPSSLLTTDKCNNVARDAFSLLDASFIASSTSIETAASPDGVTWFRTGDSDWLTKLFGDSKKGQVYFFMVPSSKDDNISNSKA